MAKYKLTYFDIRGLAESIRMTFVVGKTEFEDVRYPWTVEMKDGMPDFATIKNEEFKADQAAGKLEKSGGKVPFLEADGMCISQSQAIVRFVASECGMMGADKKEAAMIDSICEDMRDVRDAFGAARRAMMGGDKSKVEEFFKTELPALATKFDKRIPGSDGFAVGGKVSVADVIIYGMFAAPKCGLWNNDACAAALGGAPKMKAICDKMTENVEMKAYLEKRKDTAV